MQAIELQTDAMEESAVRVSNAEDVAHRHTAVFCSHTSLMCLGQASYGVAIETEAIWGRETGTKGPYRKPSMQNPGVAHVLQTVTLCIVPTVQGSLVRGPIPITARR
jgi:hypothetical protein